MSWFSENRFVMSDIENLLYYVFQLLFLHSYTIAPSSSTKPHTYLSNIHLIYVVVQHIYKCYCYRVENKESDFYVVSISNINIRNEHSFTYFKVSSSCCKVYSLKAYKSSSLSFFF